MRSRTLLTIAGLGVISCGACSGRVDFGPPPPPECAVDADCDDSNPCTIDHCDPGTRTCHSSPVTLDSDGDGHRAPRSGHVAGAPGACGDDCDDTNPHAYPGAQEVCDGADNDCNGIVDDGAHWIPQNTDPVRIDGELAPAAPGGLAFSGNVYASIYAGSTVDGPRMFASMLNPGGAKVVPPGEVPVTPQNTGAAGGSILWIGDRFGLTWNDGRTSDDEMYFAILGEDGAKKSGDVQLTSAKGFSLNPALAWNFNEFIVVWQDYRGGLPKIFGQRVDHDGNPIGGNIQLTETNSLYNGLPSVAAGTNTVGITWMFYSDPTSSIGFRVFSPDLTTPMSKLLVLTDALGATNPKVVWNKDRYVIYWFDDTANPKAIYAAVIGEDGMFMVQPKPVTNPGSFISRDPYMRALGDRLLLVYSDDRDQNDGDELYSVLISEALDPIGPEQRITNAPKDSVYPIAAFGPNGDLGILFQDDRDKAEVHVWFAQLGCVVGMSP